MSLVTREIQKILRQKDAGILDGSKAMLGILRELHGEVLNTLGRAALGTWDAYHLRQVLDQIEYQMAHYQGMSQKELSGLLDKAWDLGKDLVDKPLGAAGIYTGFHLSETVLDMLQGYSSDYLKSMFHDAWYRVKGEITLGIAGDKTPQEVTKAIGETVDEGRFANIANRAETITKHEMGTVFSEATQKRMEQAAETVDGLQKEWLHAGHPRQPRPSHVAASGQRVPVNEPFIVGGIKLMFPRDPAAPLEEVIGCGCDSRPYHASWA